MTKRLQVPQPKSVEAKLRAIEKASQYNFPTADIDVMLREIEEGRNLSRFSS